MNEKYRSVFEIPDLKFDKQGYVKNRMSRPDVFNIIERFKLGKKEEKTSILKKVSTSLVTQPEYCDLFFYCLNNYEKKYKENSVVIQSFRDSLINKHLTEVAMNQDTYSLTEGQLLGFTRMALGENPLFIKEDDINPSINNNRKMIGSTVMRGFVLGTTGSQIKEQFIVNSSAQREFIEGITKTQDKTVELFYRLTAAILPTGDMKLYRLLFNTLNFQTPILNETDYQAPLYVLAKLAINDNSLTKMQIVDHVIELFSKILPNIDKKDSEYFSEVIQHFPFSQEYVDILNRNESRAKRIADVYKEIRETVDGRGIFAPIVADDEEAVIEEYGLPFPLDYPDNQFVKTDPLWFLYTKLASEYLFNNGEIDSPVYIVAFPDNTIRSVNIAKGIGDNFTAAKILMKYVVNQPRIEGYENHFFPMSVLEYLRPQLSLKQKNYLEVSLEAIKTSLKTPSRGIPEEGVILVINEHKEQKIEACNIFFDQSGRKIRLTVGNYDLNFLLDDQLNLCCYADGKLLDLSEEAKLWWGNLILSNLEAFTSYRHEEDIILSDLTEMPLTEAVDSTKKQLLKRRGHLRREPPNRGYTEEQRNRVLELKWPLPGIGSLDLKTFNEGQGFTRFDGQYTYVLPLEKEKRSEPLRLKAPNALRKILESIG